MIINGLFKKNASSCANRESSKIYYRKFSRYDSKNRKGHHWTATTNQRSPFLFTKNVAWPWIVSSIVVNLSPTLPACIDVSEYKRWTFSCRIRLPSSDGVLHKSFGSTERQHQKYESSFTKLRISKLVQPQIPRVRCSPLRYLYSKS